jgi:wyosine [tRNA(Phe)-imidazoG37] synthetase (radical SAM superfamily)
MSSSMYGEKPTQANGAVDWPNELAPLGPRTLKVIRDISNKCNLRCRMCHFSFDTVFQREASYTSPADFERIAASALPIAHTLFLSAANEPLMSPHFTKILAIAAQYSVPKLLFLTNAQLLTPRIADALLEAGVTEVQISIDGATKETYEYIRRGARFDRLTRNLEYLTEQKRLLGRSLPQLQFNIVLMQRNLEELPLFVDLAERLGVEWIAARHLLTMRGLGMEGESLVSDRARANAHFQRFFERVERSKSVTLIEFPDLFGGETFVSKTENIVVRASSSTPAPAEQSSELARPEKPKLTITRKIAREIRRVPRNIRRAAFGQQPPRPPVRKERKLAALPFGSVDDPAAAVVVANNAVELAGWALDRLRVHYISFERQLSAGDVAVNDRGLVTIGETRMLNGSRPDVGQQFPQYPNLFRAGWRFELRREMLAPNPAEPTTIHVIAHSGDGRVAEIGQRVLSFSGTGAAKPYLFCSRPFDSVFIDSKADVRPYPDCRPTHPYGSLADQNASLFEIWFGKHFRDLRQRIIDRDPPDMCLTCAHFINRNVDDPHYFVSR